MDISCKKLDVYKLSLEFVSLSTVALKNLPRGQGHLNDQLKRAASSIVLNIVEGAGEFAKKEKVRFYRIALRSTTESASVIDIIFRCEYIDQRSYDELNCTLSRIIAMLTKLIKSHEGRILSGRVGSGGNGNSFAGNGNSFAGNGNVYGKEYLKAFFGISAKPRRILECFIRSSILLGEVPYARFAHLG